MRQSPPPRVQLPSPPAQQLPTNISLVVKESGVPVETRNSGQATPKWGGIAGAARVFDRTVDPAMIDSGVVHIIPDRDLINHETDIDSSCVCGPQVDAVMRLDGSCGWVYLHHSLDARETR